eukprot:CAMPEP_0113604510 /NCGR_PEP_ID=MMETSP0017_2-20120614/1832_1 /TAXON_ID=2856 /ORGANISM="Cylindrotheca closterium" /LENGTH=157 /DNA_ID=CAMNT_0000512937 /DNA_START=35 /DNA_END=505 /DNA_ORIENTATION=+ /assembly_acc=CAM_ASM_000147
MQSVQRKNEKTGRFVYEFNGNAVYEWEQTLDDVTIYVKPPPFVQKGNQIKCQISAKSLKVGLEGGTKWFIDEPSGGLIDVSESTWSLEEDDHDSSQKVISIYLVKANRGAQWNTALMGNGAVTALDPAAQEEVRKEMMLERFQEENPGFDFRDAEFN